MAAAFQLCAHVRNNDGCPSVNFSPLLRLIGNVDPLCPELPVETRQICEYHEYKQQNNACVSVTRALFVRQTRKINFPGHKLIFTTQDQNSGLFHGREKNFKFRAFSRFPGSVGTLQNALVPHPTMLHSEQYCAHFCSEWSSVGYGKDAFWDLWNWSIRPQYVN